MSSCLFVYLLKNITLAPVLYFASQRSAETKAVRGRARQSKSTKSDKVLQYNKVCVVTVYITELYVVLFSVL